MSEDTRDTHVYAAGDRIERAIYSGPTGGRLVVVWRRGTFNRYDKRESDIVWISADDHHHEENAFVYAIRPLSLLELMVEGMSRDY